MTTQLSKQEVATIGGPIAGPDDILDMPAVQAATSRSRNTIVRWMRDPRIKFPKPELLIGGQHFWRRRAITAWIDAMSAEQNVPKPSAATKRVQARRPAPRKHG
jgi:predicted DNA-binding transcriptional regulator AlpA